MLTCLDFLNSEVFILFHISDLSTLLRSLTLVRLWVCWHLSLPLLGLEPPALVNASAISIAQWVTGGSCDHAFCVQGAW